MGPKLRHTALASFYTFSWLLCPCLPAAVHLPVPVSCFCHYWAASWCDQCVKPSCRWRLRRQAHTVCSRMRLPCCSCACPFAHARCLLCFSTIPVTAAAALAAYVTGRQVHVQLDRLQDSQMTGGREEVQMTYELGVDASNMITAWKMNYVSNGNVLLVSRLYAA